MAVPSNTVQTFSMVGIREDLSDTITNISPTDTPFYSGCKKGKAKNRSPEWEKENLRAANADNATVEGDDATNDAMTQPTRLRNYVQLFDEVIQVSTTAQAVDTAGKSNELAHQLMKSSKAIKLDIEAAITSNNASVAGNASTAGKLGGAEAWIETNDSRGTSGADGGFNTGTNIVDAPTDGTQRAFAEAQMKDVIRQCWEAGGDPSTVMVGSFNKQAASGFSGIATQTLNYNDSKSGQGMILGAADVYVSDFGKHTVVPNRFMRTRSALVLDMSRWELKFLQPFKTEKLAKTGHSDRRMLSAELTLCVTDEAANGIVADLTTS